MTQVDAHRLADLVASAPSVDLADVEEHAALLTRVDRKYALDRVTAEAVVERLVPRAAVMTVADGRTFWYRSVYFDTPDLESYRRAATQRRLRWKVRTRSYVESGTTFVEVKQRGTRGVTEKQRISLPLDSTPEHLGPISCEWIDDTLARRGVGASLAPACTTGYQRTTLVDLDSTTRATIDTSIVLGGAETPELVIVEVKSPNGSSWFDRVLRDAGARPGSVSKFGLAMAASHPELPANRWRRQVTRHLRVGAVSPSSAPAVR
ncbi:MAG: polyphosphate polymerase domain-containing protein [Acidimicrobiales bacterium]